MRAIPCLSIVLAAAALAASTAAPVVANGLDPNQGYVQVDVEVAGYVSSDVGGFGGRLWCSSWTEPQDFAIDWGSTSTGPMPVPPGDTCAIAEFSGGDPGNLGEWGAWQASGAVQPTAGAVSTITVTIERHLNGLEPQWDAWAWFPIEVFTVDRVYVNRTGGITVEGLVWCPSLAGSPAGPEPIIGINWDATQYVGRKTAIHGSYGSDIGKLCFDSQHPTAPVRWTSMHPSGTSAATAWVYGMDGKFASGTIIVDADSLNDMSSVSQSWDPERWDYDPACSTDATPDGFFDSNGDGFCAYYIEAGQRVTAAVRTTSWKGR